MDKNFYTDNFERFLKEKSDEFRMYPVRKVWRCIYNNLYPGYRYPSAITTIAIISAISLIGFLNTRSIKTSASILNSYNSSNRIHIQGKFPSVIRNVPYSTENKNLSIEYKIKISDKIKENINENSSQIQKIFSLQKQSLPNSSITQLPTDINSTIAFNDSRNVCKKINKTYLIENKILGEVNNIDSIENIFAGNYKTHNDHTAKKWTDNLAWQIYASPYVPYEENSDPRVTSNQVQDGGTAFDNSSVGLEAGTAMQYSLSGLVKVKAGLQFNYASYNMEAYQNDFNMEISVNNGISPVMLHNEIYQFSLPVGLEFKLLKRETLQWYAGATVQPTYIAGGNAYLLSSNTHNFIDESSAINKWNFNAGFETFITYQINGLTWQFGPQVRYRFSSIYSNAYIPVDDRLANFGFKIGVSKILH